MNLCIVSRGCPNRKYPLNGIFEFDQAKALKRAGHNVMFISIDLRSIRRWRPYGYSFFLKEEIPVYEYSLPIGAIPTRLLNSIGKILLSMVLKRIIKEGISPQIIHSHFLYVSTFVVDCCKEFNIPLIITEHWSKLNFPILSNNLYNDSISVYNNACKRICVSSTFARNLKLTTNLDFDVVPNVVSVDDFNFVNRQKSKIWKFVSCGNLIKRKGFVDLLIAFSSLLKKGYECKLTIIGEGIQHKLLNKTIEKLNLKNKVVLAGHKSRKEINEIYNESDFFVLASKRETFGVVYIEAMATGLPVVATRCGGPEDFVTDENGILIPCGDIEALSNSMEKMILNENNYNRQKISENIKNQFSPQCIANKLTKIYKECIEECNIKNKKL